MKETFSDLSRGIPVIGLSDVLLEVELKILPQKGQAGVLALHKGKRTKAIFPCLVYMLVMN